MRYVVRKSLLSVHQCRFVCLWQVINAKEVCDVDSCVSFLIIEQPLSSFIQSFQCSWWPFCSQLVDVSPGQIANEKGAGLLQEWSPLTANDQDEEDQHSCWLRPHFWVRRAANRGTMRIIGGDKWKSSHSALHLDYVGNHAEDDDDGKWLWW